MCVNNKGKPVWGGYDSTIANAVIAELPTPLRWNKNVLIEYI